MSTQTTHDVKVSVEIFYQKNHTLPEEKYFFAYRVHIENQSTVDIQIISRRWEIFDSSSDCRIVEGDGVMGKQPVIAPGQKHDYVSWCQLETEIGKMEGTYLIRNEHNDFFRVRIPEFHLIAPYRLN